MQDWTRLITFIVLLLVLMVGLGVWRLLRSRSSKNQTLKPVPKKQSAPVAAIRYVSGSNVNAWDQALQAFRDKAYLDAFVWHFGESTAHRVVVVCRDAEVVMRVREIFGPAASRYDDYARKMQGLAITRFEMSEVLDHLAAGE